MPSLHARAIGLIVSGLCAAAAISVAALDGWLTTPAPHPADVHLRLLFGVLWALLQAASLASVYIATRAGFGVICGLTAIVGLTAMSIGRAGLIGGLSLGLVACIVPAALIALAMSGWLRFRPVRVTAAQRVWRLFAWLSSMATVYLYAAEPREAGAHLLAFAAAVLTCGVVVPAWPGIMRATSELLNATPSRLSILAWGGAVTALAVNTIVTLHSGLRTPQISVGPLSMAPYFLAAGLALVGVALDVEDFRVNRAGAMGRMMCGLSACAGIYFLLLHEAGTMALLAVGVVAVLLVAGPLPLAGAAIVAVACAQALLQSQFLIEAVQDHLPRIGERLLVWTHRAAPPDQLLRVLESLQFAGAFGHMGAARLRFLVGPQVSKDYVPALIAAQGGWLSLGLVLTGSMLLLAELYMAMQQTRTPVGRALQTAVLALLVGNLLVTTLWLGGLTPFVGVPLPVLARAGSHLIVLALVLLIFDAVSEADRGLLQRRL